MALREQRSACYTYCRWITGRIKRSKLQPEETEGMEEAFGLGVFLQARYAKNN